MSDVNEGNATLTAEAPAETVVSTQSDLATLFTKPLAEALEEVEVTEPEKVENSEEEETPKAEEPEVVKAEGEEAKEEESEDESVLSKQDKSVERLRKRLDKKHWQQKEAEEKTESLEKEVESLKQQLSSGSAGKSSDESFKQIAKEADNIESLQDLYDKAEKAEEWVESALDQLRDSDDDVLEIGETTYTKEMILDFKKEVKQAIRKDIPARAKVIEQRHQFDEQALTQFEFLADPESDGYKHVESIMSDKGLGEFLKGRADQMQILGYIAEGILAQEAKGKQSKAEEPKAKKSAPKVAPNIPFIKSNVATRKATPSEADVKRKDELRNKNKLSVNDLAGIFA